MVTVGKILKDEREAKGISIYEVSMSLKINAKVLTIIESDDFANPTLPSQIFIRGFIKSYSQHLKLNVDEMLKAFDSQVASVTSTPKVEANQVQEIESSEEQTLDQAEFPWKKIIVLSVVLVVLVIVVSIATTLSSQVQTQTGINDSQVPSTTLVEGLITTTSSTTLPPSAEALTTTTISNLTTTTIPPTTTVPATSTTTTLAATISEVVVEAIDEITVSYAFGTQKSTELKLAAGQIHRFKIKTKIKIEINDGSKANVFVNGIKKEKASSPGQIYTLEHP